MQICFQFVYEYIYIYIYIFTCFLSPKKKSIDKKIKLNLIKKYFFIYNFNHSNFENIYYNCQKN